MKDAVHLAPGTAVGPYTVAELIGAGGMGEVYRARDTRLGRDVAIKVLNAAPDREGLTRFEREARATALLAHPNILTVFDIGSHGGVPFLVCELLDGRTLRARLSEGPLRARDAIAIALQLARGVAAAHALRVVHRDLKPENLFLTREGTLKILDFGLAKLEVEALSAPGAETVSVTSPGLVVGTPGYMAPEQVRGLPVDERTDIFAMGVILHEMLTADQPFRRPTVAETLAAVLRDQPAPPGGDVPLALERIVTRCLEKQPDDRYQSAAELAVVLDSVRGATPRPREVADAGAKRRDVSSIAVLPFLDMSPGRDQAYLCEGIADELISALTHVEGLRVAARRSSFQFKSSGADARAVGARLGVDTVLEGGVRKVGDRLRVTVQLVDVGDACQRWAERFNGTLDDVFAIQDTIAERVATALRGILSGREREALRRPETEAAAYEYYLRGRHLVHATTQPSASLAREMFEKAIAIDPGYAPAYAGLAELHGWAYEWHGGGDAAYEQAEAATRKALELGPQLSESHTARGFVLALRGHYEEASREFEEALRLSPNSFDACYLYARACFAWKKTERSADLFRRGGSLQPDDFQCSMLLSQSLDMLGRKEEATAAAREGVRRAERRLDLQPTDTRALSLGAATLIRLGETTRAMEWCSRAVAIAPDEPTVLVNAACMYAKVGRKDEALACLEQSFGRGFGKRDWVENDPDYDPLRDDPRFQALLEKLR